MAYLSNIPQPADAPGTISQPQFLENFTQLNTQFSGDHIALTAIADNGMHSRIRFQGVAADPGLATPQASLYTKADAVSGDTELFFQNDAGAGDVTQLTGLDTNAAGTDYGMTLPSGITLNWGTATATAAGVATTFAVTFPSAVHSLTLTVNLATATTATASYGALATTGFTAYGTGTPLLISYFAIGV